MTTELFVQLCYLSASILFILGLRGLGDAQTARRGILLAEIGMALAIIGTLLRHEIITYQWILVGSVIGAAIGTWISLSIPMTMMPERIAFSHAFGGLAVSLVGISEYWHAQQEGLTLNTLQITATGFEVVLGALTFTGSLMAFGKLQGFTPGRPMTFPGQNAFNFGLIAATLGLVGYLIAFPHAVFVFYAACALALVIGVSLVLPIGGADMPVVICLLNSYAGLAASATGFALKNNVLIICGALDGGSGFILGMMMSKAMNRSFANVLFGAFGATPEGPQKQLTSTGPAPNEATVEDAADVLRAARSLIVVPGYGMAVSQAQHAVRDLAAVLKLNGCEVKYAIHPVAGRMPGHMNVLLAEANVPYDQLFDLEQINDEFSATDVALVVGANDVVNPAARTDQSSPIFGMPILNADAARTCIVLKRSLNPGFAGIENGLFVKPNTMMVLGDAKKTISAFTHTLKETA
ncbi:MAG: NAD(P)(+) transhydrogenase (Re/Si-specific) subunit beta [Deltaproteobacteria bacterium]|nr:NAD(P)(+) transhydrogenase (Re/Si-specific) subunit beta [Deltaproteobacteria bacterium]